MREKTNSITHLVKIVAEEVFDQKIEEFKGELDIEEITKKAIGKIQTSLKHAGDIWDKKECEILKAEFRVALNQIAVNHGRSTGAIRERLKFEGLVF